MKQEEQMIKNYNHFATISTSKMGGMKWYELDKFTKSLKLMPPKLH